MSAKLLSNSGLASVTDVVGDAVGVAERKWFVAVVTHNTEKAAEERLQKLNYEVYVAKQSVTRIWKNGRKAKVDKVVIPSLVFIKCTEAERRNIVTFPFIKRFLVNKAGKNENSLTKPLAIVSQREIDQLRYMLGQSNIPVTFIDTPFKVKSKVIVVRGDLKGIEGEVIQASDGKSDVVVKIDLLGAAKMSIDTADLELVKE